MWALIRTQVLWGRFCQVMSEPNLWNGTRNKDKIFRNKEELLSCVDDINVLWQACFWKFVFEIGQDGPLSEIRYSAPYF